MYYALATIFGVAIGMVIMSLLVSASRDDEQTQHILDLQDEYQRGYRQAMFENGLATNAWHKEWDYEKE